MYVYHIYQIRSVVVVEQYVIGSFISICIAILCKVGVIILLIIRLTQDYDVMWSDLCQDLHLRLAIPSHLPWVCLPSFPPPHHPTTTFLLPPHNHPQLLKLCIFAVALLQPIPRVYTCFNIAFLARHNRLATKTRAWRDWIITNTSLATPFHNCSQHHNTTSPTRRNRLNINTWLKLSS